MENVRQQFATLLGKRKGLVTNSFDEDSAEYQEFFPHGLTEYSNATLENMETLMNRIITAATAHAGELGNNFASEFSTLKDAFLAARGKQLGQKGSVGKASEATEEARTALEIQLTRNLLTIALNNIGNTGAAAKFFDKSIISRPAGDNLLSDSKPEPVK